MKRLVGIFLTLALVLTFASSAFADEQIFIDPTTGTLGTGIENVTSADQPEGWAVRLAGIDDDFADGIRGWQWDIIDGSNPPTEAGGVLNCDKDNSGGGSVARTGYITSFNITGDFDIQVDFAGFGRTSGTVSLALRFLITLTVDQAAMYRFNDGASDRWIADGYVGSGYYSSIDNTAVTSGKFRLKRVGTIMYHYIDIGAGWVLAHTENPFSGSDGTIEIYGHTSASSEGTGDFDNFVANVGGFYLDTSPTACQDISFPTDEHATFTSWDSITDCDESGADDLLDIKIYNTTSSGYDTYDTDAELNAIISGKASTLYNEVCWILKTDSTRCEVYGGVVGVTDAVGDYPVVGDVESGVSYNFGSSTGTFIEPGIGNVEEGVPYGGSGTEFTGTFVVPGVALVNAGTTYGDSEEFTGTFEGEGDVIFGM